MSLSQSEAHAIYNRQWQSMPGAVCDWQNNESEQNHPGRRIAVEYIAQAGKSVLEVGCGIGVDYPRFKAAGVEYFGVDITPKYIREAKRRGVPCKIADALHLPFPDNSFDSVYSKDLLLHLPPGDWRKALSEMARVARTQIVVVDHKWEPKTRYLLAETYKTKKGGDLFFYNNVYSQTEVEDFICGLGWGMVVVETGSASIGSICVQRNIVTVFKRKKGE